jgi:hypothetical protein
LHVQARKYGASSGRPLRQESWSKTPFVTPRQMLTRLRSMASGKNQRQVELDSLRLQSEPNLKAIRGTSRPKQD